jgi:hypothetical protein
VAGADEDAALTGDLDITSSVLIKGAGVGATVLDGLQLDRIFEVLGNTTLRLADLTLQNGKIGAGGLYGGGAIRVNNSGTIDLNHVVLQNNQTENTGGAIDNSGTAVINFTTLDSNSSTQTGSGGAIYNAGFIIIQNTTISNNTSTNWGGGLDNSSNATLINVTFSGNSSNEGGGMFNDGYDVSLYNVTFMGNNTAIYNTSELRLKNSILAGSTSGVNCIIVSPGVITTLGHNLDSGTTCGFTGLGDLQNTDPLLGPLSDNQGPTFTHALLNDSPAIDAGDTGIDCPDTDQRGAMRPADGDGDLNSLCDIGAYEQPVAVTGTVVNRIVALVDGDPITMHEVSTFTASDPRLAEAARTDQGGVLDLLITQRILAKEIQAQGITISDAEIDRYVASIRQRNNLSEEQLDAALAQQGLTMARYRAQIKEELEAGAWKVITEGRESGTVGLYRGSGEIRTGLIDEIESQIDTARLMFEAPQKAQQVWLIKHFGPNVNLGNIPPGEVIALETMRQGLRADTMLERRRAR